MDVGAFQHGRDRARPSRAEVLQLPLYAKTDFAHCYQWIAEGLNHVTVYIAKKKMRSFIGGTVEPKPNEPRGAMFLPFAKRL